MILPTGQAPVLGYIWLSSANSYFGSIGHLLGRQRSTKSVICPWRRTPNIQRTKPADPHKRFAPLYENVSRSANPQLDYLVIAEAFYKYGHHLFGACRRRRLQTLPIVRSTKIPNRRRKLHRDTGARVARSGHRQSQIHGTGHTRGGLNWTCRRQTKSRHTIHLDYIDDQSAEHADHRRMRPYSGLFLFL